MKVTESRYVQCIINYLIEEFYFSDHNELLVATQAHGTNGFEEWLMKFHGQKLRDPIHPAYQPSEDFLGWHVREVFRGPARYQAGDIN